MAKKAAKPAAKPAAAKKPQTRKLTPLEITKDELSRIYDDMLGPRRYALGNPAIYPAYEEAGLVIFNAKITGPNGSVAMRLTDEGKARLAELKGHGGEMDGEDQGDVPDEDAESPDEDDEDSDVSAAPGDFEYVASVPKVRRTRSASVWDSEFAAYPEPADGRLPSRVYALDDSRIPESTNDPVHFVASRAIQYKTQFRKDTGKTKKGRVKDVVPVYDYPVDFRVSAEHKNGAVAGIRVTRIR